MTRPRRFAALSALAGLLILPLAACGSDEQGGSEEGGAAPEESAAVAPEPAQEGDVDAWREAARAIAHEGNEGCVDMLPDETVALIDGITGSELDWVQAIAFDSSEDIMCHYRSGMGTTEEREVRVDLEFEKVLCDSDQTDGPEVYTGTPQEGTNEVDGEEVEVRLSSVTACGESGVALVAVITALRDSETYDLLTDDDYGAEIAESLVAQEEQILERASVLREEALAAEG